MARNIKAVIKGYSRQKEEEQTQLIAQENKLPYVNLVNYAFTGDVLGVLPLTVTKRFSIIAFQRLGNTVKVATPYPHQTGLAEIMNQLGTEKDATFEPHVCSLSSFDYGLGQYEKLVRQQTETEARASRQSVEQFLSQLRGLNDLQGAVQAINTTEILELILSGALAFDATDVHLEPESDHVRVRFRVDGELVNVAKLELGQYKLLLSRVKNLAKLKLNRLAGPQDGRFSLKVASETIDIRISILPASYGETIELRLLTGKGLLDLDKLGLNEATKTAILRNIAAETGLIIITGPTGSGKTTTLYSILQLLNQPAKKIITIEDPVEYKIPGLEQIQVDPSSGFDFAQALRGVLRQDPDVVLIGEIRDKETADIAINAALTGHLVLTTLHTNSAPAVFNRLIEMGVSPFLVTDAIRLIIAQRLIKRVCSTCQGAGCDTCRGTGFKGQVAISEFLEPGAEFTELVRRKASITEFNALYAQLGYKTMADDQEEKRRNGLIAPAKN